MQIHELNTFAGTPGDSNFLAIDNGVDTGKISGSNLLSPVNAKVDNIAKTVTPDSAVVLLDYPAGIGTGTKTLSLSTTNFDYLEFYIGFNNDMKTNGNYIRVPVDQGGVEINVPVKDGKNAYIQRIVLSWSGASLTESGVSLWEWDGESASDALSQSSVWIADVIRVVGIKTSSNTPAELADLRVGANGIIYDTAGNAVRRQISELADKSDTDLNNYEVISGDLLFEEGSQITLPTEDTATVKIKNLSGAIYTGGHNLAPLIPFKAGTYTKNDVTFVVSDNVITINGTASDSIYFVPHLGTFGVDQAMLANDYKLPAKTLRIGAAFENITANTASFNIRSRISGNIVNLNPNSSNAAIDYDYTTYGQAYVYVPSGASITNGKITFWLADNDLGYPYNYANEYNTIRKITNVYADIDTYTFVDGSASVYEIESNIPTIDFINNVFQNIDISNIDGVTKVESASFSAQSTGGVSRVECQVLQSYDTYWFYADEGAELYFESANMSPPAYIACTIGYGPTKEWQTTGGGVLYMVCDSAIRYRNTEGNLPISSSPLDVSGAIVLITVNHGTTCSITINNRKELASDVKLGSGQLDTTLTVAGKAADAAAVGAAIAGKKNKVLQYSAGTLFVYIPTAVGYVRYDFTHSIQAGSYCDVWRMNNAAAVDNSFNFRFNLTTAGEWECALHLLNRNDFSGGFAHGDEIYNAITFFVNGVPVDITQYTNMTVFDTLEVVQVSDLYDPADHTTIIAEHGSSHVWSDEGLKIAQSIKWKVAERITACYLAMFPAAKAVTNRLFTDNGFNTVVVDGSSKTYKDVKNAVLYSESVGFMGQFGIGEYPNNVDATGNIFLTTDNTVDQSGLYNKCYYVIATSSATHTTAIGELWKSETFYKLEVGK